MHIRQNRPHCQLEPDRAKKTGYTSRDVVGKNYSILFTKEDVRQGTVPRALAVAAQTGHVTLEGIRIKKNGAHFWARSFITLVTEGDRGASFFAVIAQDMTREVAARQKRDAYIGIASHELKNPITTLSLYSELLAKRLELEHNKKDLHLLRDMQTQTARLVTLIDDLLTVSRLDGNKLQLNKEAFNVDSFIADIVRNFQNTTSTHAIVYKSTHKPRVYADKAQIAQVLINLLTNAVKYSPQSHTVLVHTSPLRKKCLISIQDFGSGIAKKNQRKIFTRFFRIHNAEVTDPAGSGLGLFIAKEIIQRHRERLVVTSTEGKGSTFSFTLPLA